MTVATFYITRHVRALVRTSAAGTAPRAALQITIPCLRHRAAPIYFILYFSRALISFAEFSSWLAFMTRSSLGDRYLISIWQIRPRTRPYQTCIGIFSRIILGVTHKPDHGCAFVACPDAGEGYSPSGQAEWYHSDKIYLSNTETYFGVKFHARGVPYPVDALSQVSFTHDGS